MVSDTGAIVSAPAGTSATSTTPAPSAHASPPSAAKQSAFARAVNLTAEDLPGFSASPRERPSHTPGEEALQQRLTGCLGGRGTGGRASHGSPQFTRRGNVLGQSVSSGVSFAASLQAADADLAQLRSAHTRGCLGSYLEQLFKSKRFGGAAVQRVSIMAGTPPAPGTAGGFGWRITARLLVRGLPVPFYLDILGFVFGPAEVTLQSAGVLVPFPAGAEEQLFRLLLRRARANSP